MNDNELKVQGAELMLNVLFESSRDGYSFGRVVERFKELGGIQGIQGLYQRLQCAGGLTVNNAIFGQVEAEGRA